MLHCDAIPTPCGVTPFLRFFVAAQNERLSSSPVFCLVLDCSFDPPSIEEVAIRLDERGQVERVLSY